MADNEGAARRAVKTLRREEADDSSVMGYEDAAGIPHSVQGDQEAPWHKNPPFPSDVESFYDKALPLAGAGYEDTNPISVRDRRLLLLWILYTSADAVGQLSLIPEGAKSDEEGVFFPIAVVNPFITVLGAPLAGFGSRDVLETELRLQPTAAAATRSLGALAFDVAGYDRFRFRVAELSPTAGTAQLGYSFAS